MKLGQELPQASIKQVHVKVALQSLCCRNQNKQLACPHIVPHRPSVLHLQPVEPVLLSAGWKKCHVCSFTGIKKSPQARFSHLNLSCQYFPSFSPSVFAITRLTPKFLIIQCCLHEKVHELLLLSYRVHHYILQGSMTDGCATLCIIVSMSILINAYYQWLYKQTYWFGRTEHTTASQSACTRLSNQKR